MNKRILIVAGTIVLALTLTVLFVGVTQSMAAVIERPTCGLGNTVPGWGENHVEFAASWFGGFEQGEYPFQFDDGSMVVFTGTQGSKLFSHDYSYIEGGIITYTVGFTVTSDITTTVAYCHNDIVIDFRPQAVTYNIFLPLVSKPAHVPACTVAVAEQTVNHVVFDVDWQNAGDGTHTFSFGDGTETKQFSGSVGSSNTWHDYAWPGGNFTAMLSLDGGGTCSVHITVNWP